MYGDTQCKQDYVVIAGGSQTGGSQDTLFTRDRFCGLALGYCGTMTVGATSCTAFAGAVTSKSADAFPVSGHVSLIFFSLHEAVRPQSGYRSRRWNWSLNHGEVEQRLPSAIQPTTLQQHRLK